MDDSTDRERWTPTLWVVAAVALVLCGTGLVLLIQANAGLEIEATRLGPTPVTVFRHEGVTPDASLPVVVIAHGFAGSQQLMRPFAVSLARNGYLAVTFDYYGHGRNLERLSGDVSDVDGATQKLLAQTHGVVDYAMSLPDAGDGLAVLGHSMASDIVARYAQQDERVDATVAVSMFSPAVTATSPGNLLIVVGGLERFLQQEALRVLGLVTDTPDVGVTVGDIDAGTARRVAVSAGVEHLGVLYSRDSMREAVAWLDQVYGRSSEGQLDSRGPAIVLLILGVVLLARPLARYLPSVSRPPTGASLGWRRLFPAAVIPALATPLLLWPFPADFMGVLVGGYLAVHFLVYGLVTMACLWWIRHVDGGSPRKRIRTRVFVAASVSATLYIAGLMAVLLDQTVTSFAITEPRLPLVFAMLAGTLSYFLADEWLTHGAKTACGGQWFTRLCFLASLGLAVALSFEDLFFLFIIAAVIVIYFVVYGMFSKWIYRATGHPGVGAVANAVAFAWALAVVFPMMSG